MNVGGHIAIAAALGGTAIDPGLLLGAALPDLSTMGGLRLLGVSSDPAVTAGIKLHHQTDDAFHRHGWFTGRNRALRTELLEAGFARGPARACSHVGIELLLDGELLAAPVLTAATEAAFDAIEPRLDALETLVRSAETEKWRHHLGVLAKRRLPTDYADADAVAERLYRILLRRPRLAFAPHLVGIVASALAETQPAIIDTAWPLIASLVQQLEPTWSETPGLESDST